MIIRKDVGTYSFADESGKVERNLEDFDLAFDHYKIYVLDDHEWYNPHTSTKGRHRMNGPAVIVLNEAGGSMSSVEYHVNDPRVWAWIRRTIVEEYFTSETITPGLNDEKDIHIN